jgi:hypothetical protein
MRVHHPATEDNWPSQTAQVVLARFSLAKKRPAEGRIATVTGLAAALILPVLGNTADNPLRNDGSVVLLHVLCILRQQRA